MRRLLIKIAMLVAVVALCQSCGEQETITKYDLGSCEHYSAFLWVPEKNTAIEKKIVLDFNQEAKTEHSRATISLRDKNKELLNLHEFEVSIDGEILKKPEIEINASQKEMTLKIGCAKDAKQGHKSFDFYIEPGHTLDKVNDMHNPTQILRCDFRFEQNMNPCLVVLLWVLAIILTILILWLICVRYIVYPRFKSIKKSIFIPGYAPITINFKGARLVVIDKNVHKQSVWDKIFKGKIKYIQHPAFATSVKMKPHKRGVLVVANTSQYRVQPNPIPRIGSAIMVDLSNNQQFTIQ